MCQFSSLIHLPTPTRPVIFLPFIHLPTPTRSVIFLLLFIPPPHPDRSVIFFLQCDPAVTSFCFVLLVCFSLSVVFQLRLEKLLLAHHIGRQHVALAEFHYLINSPLCSLHTFVRAARLDEVSSQARRTRPCHQNQSPGEGDREVTTTTP